MSIYLAIAITAVISSIVGSIIGFIWYGPVFGKLYASIMGMDMGDQTKMAEAKKIMPFMYGINFGISFLMYYAFGFSAAVLINPSMTKGIIFFALFIWLGFIVPLAGSGALWSGKSPKASFQLFLITAGYQLVMILLAGLIWITVFPHLM
jgi:hypothetical protein